jgi:hypothetical protein
MNYKIKFWDKYLSHADAALIHRFDDEPAECQIASVLEDDARRRMVSGGACMIVRYPSGALEEWDVSSTTTVVYQAKPKKLGFPS